MPANTANKNACQSEVPGNWFDGQKRFCVVLEGIRSDIETPDSFAIKFSLLTKTPISKVKLIVSKLPAQIWSGQGRRRAESILTLIEEAGGRGKVVEAVSSAPVKSAEKDTASRMSCRWCGFPMKEGETRCGFCMMAQAEVEKTERDRERKKPPKVISRKRLIWYVIIGIVVIIVAIVMR